MIQELKELWITIKEDPKEFVVSLITILLLFGLFYVAVWLDAIISGRV
jgi:hypothetical protein